jgi:hypothetical protein
VKLYHFTSADCLTLIRERGLLPSEPSINDHDLMDGESVVWLTELADTRMTAAECEQANYHGGDDGNGHWFGHGKPLARLTLRIPSHDRKLVRYMSWARKHAIEEKLDNPLFKTRFAQANWIYLGIIAPDKIIACDEAALRAA